MADNYATSLANDIVQNGDQNGDTLGQNFNNGVVAPISNEVQGPITGEVRGPVPDDRTDYTEEGEDPLFSAIAGNNQEFVNGIPKEQWDAMSPEDKQKWVPSDGTRMVAHAIGTAAGATPGAIMAAVPGLQVPGTIAGAVGGAIGYDAADNWLNRPQTVTSRADLYNQFQDIKKGGRD